MLAYLKKHFTTILLMVIALMLGAILMRMSMPAVPQQPQPEGYSEQVLPTDTNETQRIAQQNTPELTGTPTRTLTPTVTNTLLPPPTFEPETATPFPSPELSPTATEPIVVEVTIEGLRGAETATPSTTPGCEPRTDWTLTYEVQRDDALANIAQRYGTTVAELADGNCIDDPNLIRLGQILRVPGDSQPVDPPLECFPYEVRTPLDGTQNINAGDQLTFNWYGPRAYYHVLRITREDGSIAFEAVVELRQNEVVDLYEDLKESGTFYWYVFPLDQNFQPVGCREGGPWVFSKGPAPTETPTIEPVGVGP